MTQTMEKARQQSLRRAERRLRNVRSTMRVNGWLLILASPVMLLIGLGRAAAGERPLLESLGALLVGAIFLVPGILAVRAARRMRQPAWLENLRSGEADAADPPQQPVPAEESRE